MASESMRENNISEEELEIRVCGPEVSLWVKRGDDWSVVQASVRHMSASLVFQDRPLMTTNAEAVRLREALRAIQNRLEFAFGAGVFDMPAPNPNGPTRSDHQRAAVYSIIETCRKALGPSDEHQQ